MKARMQTANLPNFSLSDNLTDVFSCAVTPLFFKGLRRLVFGRRGLVLWPGFSPRIGRGGRRILVLDLRSSVPGTRQQVFLDTESADRKSAERVELPIPPVLTRCQLFFSRHVGGDLSVNRRGNAMSSHLQERVISELSQRACSASAFRSKSGIGK
jgi:hypothetical protein